MTHPVLHRKNTCPRCGAVSQCRCMGPKLETSELCAKCRAEDDPSKPVHDFIDAKLAQANARIAELEEALRKYGDHASRCKMRCVQVQGFVFDCDCGYSAALAGGGR